jgi:hypothetical protein
MEEATRATVDECGERADTIEFIDALSWVFRQRSRSIPEKLGAIAKLTSLKGKVSIPSLRRFLGW